MRTPKPSFFSFMTLFLVFRATFALICSFPRLGSPQEAFFFQFPEYEFIFLSCSLLCTCLILRVPFLSFSLAFLRKNNDLRKDLLKFLALFSAGVLGILFCVALVNPQLKINFFIFSDHSFLKAFFSFNFFLLLFFLFKTYFLHAAHFLEKNHGELKDEGFLLKLSLYESLLFAVVLFSSLRTFDFFFLSFVFSFFIFAYVFNGCFQKKHQLSLYAFFACFLFLNTVFFIFGVSAEELLLPSLSLQIIPFSVLWLFSVLLSVALFLNYLIYLKKSFKMKLSTDF